MSVPKTRPGQRPRRSFDLVEVRNNLPRLLGGLDRPARQHRDTVRGEQILRLVLVEVHWLSLPTSTAHSGVRARWADPSDADRTRSDLVR